MIVARRLQRKGEGLMKVQLNGETMYLSLIEEGAALFQSKEYALAVTRFWKAFQLRPSAPVVLFNIARTMEELNDARCEDFYAAAATQGNVDALYQLATFCLRHGRACEAIDHMKAFLRLHKGKEDYFTEWARNELHRLCPAPMLVWSKGRSLHQGT
jgi:tetratricopeptide (TPR) repeat protein